VGESATHGVGLSRAAGCVLRFLAGAAAFGLVLAATSPPVASAKTVTVGDRAATRVYIAANYELVRAARTNLHAGEAAIRRLVSQTVGECRGAGEGSSATQAASEVSEEIVGTMVAIAYRPDAGAIDAFVAAVRPLRWSNRRLTRIVRVYLRKLENLAVLAPADICGDVKAWAADGFETAPEGTTRFNKLYLAADIEAEEVPLALLAPYEDRHEMTLLRRTQKLEAPLAQAEADGVERWMEIMRGLALSA
jgi:hypothetical protein